LPEQSCFVIDEPERKQWNAKLGVKLNMRKLILIEVTAGHRVCGNNRRLITPKPEGWSIGRTTAAFA
jgi:hypothetical protein